MIIFSEEKHTYTHLESGNKLTGWTSLIKKFTKSFDSDSQSKVSAYNELYTTERCNEIIKSRYRKIWGITPLDKLKALELSLGRLPEGAGEAFIEKWNSVAETGSKFHRAQEIASYERGYEICPFTEEEFKVIKLEKQYDNQSAHDCLIELEDGYYPEILVWDYSMPQSNTVVTQIDKCFIKTEENGVRYVSVDDYKTNQSKIWNSKDIKMLNPLHDFYDNTEEKYKLQACFGAKLLETHGFTPLYCAFTHHTGENFSKKKFYPTRYDKTIMDNFQKAWKKEFNVDDKFSNLPENFNF